jgi:integrase
MEGEMPRPSKGPRLYLRKRAGQESVYYIRDGTKEVSTGCVASDVDGATEALREYLAEHFRPETGERNLNKIYISEVLMLYLQDLPADSPSRETFKYHVKALSAYWGDKSLGDVKGSTCREYVANRTQTPIGSANLATGKRTAAVMASTARAELKTLGQAINHWHRESPLSAVPKVWLPKPGSRRERVLERNEVAALLKACRSLSRQGRKAAKGATQYTDYSHVARFILIGVYTGTRHDAILRLRWQQSERHGHIDTDRSVLFRRGSLERDTSKRRPPVQIRQFALRFFLDGWKRKDEEQEVSFVIHHKGEALRKMRKAWKTVRESAGMAEDVTPHVLRHTCVSWLLWGREAKGARPATKPLTIWEVAGIVGADASTIEKVYGHHRKPE